MGIGQEYFVKPIKYWLRDENMLSIVNCGNNLKKFKSNIRKLNVKLFHRIKWLRIVIKNRIKKTKVLFMKYDFSYV